jgi:hypothetical protein
MEILRERCAVTGNQNWGRMDSVHLIASELHITKRVD